MRTSAARWLLMSKNMMMSLIRVRDRTASRRGRLAAAAVLAVGACIPTVLAVADRPAVAHELAQSFRREPDHFLELYFTDPAELPVTVPAGQSRELSFTVVSHQPDTADCSFEARVGTGGESHRIASGKLLLQSGRTRVERVSFRAPPPGMEFTVTISLDGRPERIRLLGRAV